MLIQGIHYAVEEALANVGELGSSNSPRRRCILRLQQNLIDIARISENIQESMLHNITEHASTSKAPTIEEESTPQSVAGNHGGVPPPTAFIPVHTRIEGSDELVTLRLEPLPCRSDQKRNMSSPSENQIPDWDRRSKRKAPRTDDHISQPPPAKRPRLSPNGSIYLRPTHQKREHTSVLGWARWMFTAPRK